MLFKLRVLVKIVLTLVFLDHKLSYLHVLQCSHHSSSFFTIVFISFSPGDPLALGPLPLGYPNGKYNNNNKNLIMYPMTIMITCVNLVAFARARSVRIRHPILKCLHKMSNAGDETDVLLWDRGWILSPNPSNWTSAAVKRVEYGFYAFSALIHGCTVVTDEIRNTSLGRQCIFGVM